MVSFTTLVAVDEVHVAELKSTWPTWKRHRPELLQRKLLLLCDAARTQADWEKTLRFVDHPGKQIVLWDSPISDQREKMLSSLVFGAARHVTTPWYLKLDTDAAALQPGSWLEQEWFREDETGRLPAFIASPWAYTKPGKWIDRIEQWAATVPELAAHPPLNLRSNPGSNKVLHPRIISWCFFGNTEWTKRMAALCGDRLPIPSQDTFLWYCAERQRDFYRRVRMNRFGWKHIACRRRLKGACNAAMKGSIANINITTAPLAQSPTSPTDRNDASADPRSAAAKPESRAAEVSAGSLNGHVRRRPPKHLQSFIDLIRGLKTENLRGAEIGVASGDTSRALLERFPKLRLQMIDSWSTYGESHPYFISGDGCAKLTAEQQSQRAMQAAQATGFASKRRTILALDSGAAADRVEKESLDFLFVDADHTYQGLRADLQAWWPRVRPGGVMFGKDYGGVRDRLGLFGVSQAVDEFADRYGQSVKRSSGSVWSIAKPKPAVVPPIVSNSRISFAGRSDRGVVYLLTGAAHADRLVVSLWSLRKHYDGPVTVYTTQPESHEIGRLCAADSRLNIEHRTARQTPTRRNSSFLTKVEILPHVPYDTALYLDADTLVAGDISEMFALSEREPIGLTRFSTWVTSGKIMRRRLEAWRTLRMRRSQRRYVEELVSEGVKSYPAVNGGVVSVRRDAEFLKAWHELSLLGKKTFICDEIAMQLLLPRFAHKLMDCRYNCSPIYARSTDDVRIWHFHGEKHLSRKEGRALWLPAYEECLRERIARVDEWTRTAPQVAELNLALS